MDYSIDKNLLQGLRDNDDAAFKYLYQTSFIAVHSIATNSSRNKEDGEDLYNDGIMEKGSVKNEFSDISWFFYIFFNHTLSLCP